MSKNKHVVYLNSPLDYSTAICYICKKPIEKYEPYQVIGLDKDDKKVVRHKNHKKLLLQLARKNLIKPKGE